MENNDKNLREIVGDLVHKVKGIEHQKPIHHPTSTIPEEEYYTLKKTLRDYKQKTRIQGQELSKFRLQK